MNHFSINDIENLTGIKAHTLRIWEQRYSVCPSQRKDSGHRFYDGDDLKHMLRLALMYKCGYRISLLAEMDETALKELTVSAAASVKPSNQVLQLINATFDFDEVAFDYFLNLYEQQYGFEKMVTEILFPYLEKIGMLWLTDELIPAQEHFGSGQIVKRMMVAIQQLKPVQSVENSCVLLFTPPGEPHEIPLLFMHYSLKLHNIHCVYMGTGVSLESLQIVMETKKISHLYVHLVTQLCGTDPLNYISQLARKFPAQKIVVSGPAMSWNDLLMPAEVTWLRTHKEMSSFASTLQL